ncbi:permease prefix domain 1-containing protein [Paenibacillus sp. GCM10027626]|uniref:permease prefix domain 1-containing protein n=1 Tax=Paenibacillus sp. GCM10027626 TaxID=3273411 RepID=UPI003643D79C
MKRIDDFINSVYVNVQDRDEANDLKAEMRSHLLESVQELKGKGLSEREAVSLAIERFGNEHMLRKKVVEHFQASSIFAVNLLRVAIVFGVAALLIFGYITYDENRVHYERERVGQEVLAILTGGQEISEASKEDIAKIAQSFPRIKRLHISPISANEAGSEGFTYNHPKPFKKILYMNATEGISAENGTWRVDVSYESNQTAWVNLLLASLVIYWVLFAVWGIIQAYRQRRLNAGWVVAFGLFNAPAYLVYRTSLRWLSPEAAA